MTPIENLRQLGLDLPPAPKPVGAYTPAVRSGNLLFVSGQLPTKNGELLLKGRVGEEVSVDHARQCACQAALNALAVINAEAGGLKHVARVVRLTGYVASGKGFTDQAHVLNAASELMVQVFGDAGRHARAAVGAAELPLGSPVELELIVEIRPT